MGTTSPSTARRHAPPVSLRTSQSVPSLRQVSAELWHGRIHLPRASAYCPIDDPLPVRVHVVHATAVALPVSSHRFHARVSRGGVTTRALRDPGGTVPAPGQLRHTLAGTGPQERARRHARRWPDGAAVAGRIAMTYAELWEEQRGVAPRGLDTPITSADLCAVPPAALRQSCAGGDRSENRRAILSDLPGFVGS
jgi:hypothetical protein